MPTSRTYRKRKEAILFTRRSSGSPDALEAELSAKESEFIKANDPAIGYNARLNSRRKPVTIPMFSARSRQVTCWEPARTFAPARSSAASFFLFEKIVTRVNRIGNLRNVRGKDFPEIWFSICGGNGSV
jgi:hypothetical protein